MSVDRDEPSLEVQADPDIALMHFERQVLVDHSSLGVQAGKLIHTVTFRPEPSTDGLGLVVDSGEPLGPNYIRPVAGLRIVEASADLRLVRVLDINGTPGAKKLGKATVTDLCRWGTDFAVSNKLEVAFSRVQSFNLWVQNGGVAKCFFGLEEGELPASSRQCQVTRELDGMSAIEFMLASDVHKAIGYVELGGQS